ncbi:hypothetical protein DFH27DRAFT_644788 [Peziza echinospora]|nr:hypothetical protein DFH27DRAFT_644788 [Peziza echinospora]
MRELNFAQAAWVGMPAFFLALLPFLLLHLRSNSYDMCKKYMQRYQHQFFHTRSRRNHTNTTDYQPPFEPPPPRQRIFVYPRRSTTRTKNGVFQTVTSNEQLRYSKSHASHISSTYDRKASMENLSRPVDMTALNTVVIRQIEIPMLAVGEPCAADVAALKGRPEEHNSEPKRVGTLGISISAIICGKETQMTKCLCGEKKNMEKRLWTWVFIYSSQE